MSGSGSSVLDLRDSPPARDKGLVVGDCKALDDAEALRASWEVREEEELMD